MVLRLFGYAPSTCTACVATVLREKIPFEVVPVDIKKGEQKNTCVPPETAIQSGSLCRKSVQRLDPSVRSLTLPEDDDGLTVLENHAIGRYFDAKFPNQGPKLVPTGLKENSLFEQAVSVEQSHCDPYASKAHIERVFTPYVSF